MLLRLFCLLIFPASCAVAQERTENWHLDMDSAVLNLVVPIQTKESPTRELSWQQPFAKQGVRYVRLEFSEVQGGADADIELRIVREPLGELLASYRWQDLMAGGESILTGLLPAGTLRLQVVQGRVRSAASFKLAKLHWKTPRSTLDPQSAGVPKDMPLAAFPASHAVHTWAQSVTMLHIGPTAATCTGFLVASNLLATNHHCMTMSLQYLKSERTHRPVCGDVLVEFDYVRNERGPTTECLDVVKADEPNDFALLRLAHVPKASNGADRRAMPLSTIMPEVGASLSLLHHPSGLPLAVEIPCNFRGVEGSDLLHDCQTIPGSSGSALFSGNGAAVGIHYKGAYPPDWSLQQIYDDRQANGPRYNRAKPATLLEP